MDNERLQAGKELEMLIARTEFKIDSLRKLLEDHPRGFSVSSFVFDGASLDEAITNSIRVFQEEAASLRKKLAAL